MKETKFKDTELGEIPEEWSVVTFEEIGVFSKGKGISRSEANSGLIPAIRYGEIYTKHHNYIKEYGSFISHEVAVTSRKLKKGDLLFTASGETKEKIGKSVAFISSEVAYAGGDIIILTPTREIDALYLGYASNVSFVQKQKSTKGQGDAVVHITTNSLKNIKLLAPSLAEQQRIASALFDADALVAELDALIEKKRAIMAGTMQELLTGKRRLKGFSEPWSEEVLRNHLSFLPGFPFTSDRFSKVACGPRLIRNRDLHSDDQVIYYTGEYSNQYIIEDGDLLIGMDGDFTPCLWNKGNAVLNQRVGRIICKNTANIVFLYYLLQKPLAELQESTGATTVKHLSHSTIENMVCRMPKLAEQRAIASILSDMDAEIAELEAKRDKYKEVRQGMMQQLLTGKIRLI